MEEEIIASVKEVIKKESSAELSNFIINTLDTIIRRMKKANITDTIERFGEDKKNHFNSLVDEKTIQEYSNFITNRNSVAHSGSSRETSWWEVQEIADIGEKMLNAFRATLDI